MENKFPILSTARLNLIEIKQYHLHDIFEIFGDANVTRFYNVLTLKNENEAHPIIEWFQKRFHEKAGIRWGITLKGNNEIVGTIGFNNYTSGHRANIGFDLKSTYWNQGIMSEALDEVLLFGFEDLQVNRIEGEVMQGNLVSEKTLQKAGFVKEGILRQWMRWNDNYYDMSMFALLKNDWVENFNSKN